MCRTRSSCSAEITRAWSSQWLLALLVSTLMPKPLARESAGCALTVGRAASAGAELVVLRPPKARAVTVSTVPVARTRARRRGRRNSDRDRAGVIGNAGPFPAPAELAVGFGLGGPAWLRDMRPVSASPRGEPGGWLARSGFPAPARHGGGRKPRAGQDSAEAR